MDTLLVDATIVIEHLKKNKSLLISVYDHYSLLMSVVTFAELLSAKKAGNSNVNREIRDFVSEYFELVNVDQEIAKYAADLLRSKEITLAHALIAATAIQKEIPLLTYDIEVFDRIPHLKLVDI